ATFTGAPGEVELVVLAPGHFHASLLQNNNLPQVNDTVQVFAPSGSELRQYLSSIDLYNSRADNPTKWVEEVYEGDDFLEKMLAANSGNVVVLAGNNENKTEYINKVISSKRNVLSDKPMAINSEDFGLLKEAYAKAEENGVYLYDIMTERYDLLNVIEKELINDSDFFGALQEGSEDAPAVSMESVHHFYKEVSGVPLIRPAWYYDTEQQGEGIADVTTHLIDQVFWKCFPGESVIYDNDIADIRASHWPTDITLEQYSKSTTLDQFPDYLSKDVKDGILSVFANGTIGFKVKNHNVGLKVLWNWQAPEGGGDTFTAVVKGTKAILRTEQNAELGFVKQLFVEKADDVDDHEFLKSLENAVNRLKSKYNFISFSETSKKGVYMINIPVEKREGHESHFKYVAEQFFSYLVDRNLPKWEIDNTLSKYYITTKAVEIAND
ncbi:MAG: putative oxidoreductase C-terminal domain-containing protein, partial [Fermentimonas sp.]